MTKTDLSEFVYPARAERVVDGDTLVMTIDLGFDISKVSVKVRLVDVDTHEIHFVSHDSTEYERGIEEAEFTDNWVQEAEDACDSEWPLLIDTLKDDNTGKYGRYLGYVYAKTKDRSLNSTLLDEFDGVTYEG